uniref:Uncharacterized protein n=1 Tax=Triticum urartu TaxID=4572 RepID=A0A8R7UT94_TRIUA
MICLEQEHERPAVRSNAKLAVTQSDVVKIVFLVKEQKVQSTTSRITLGGSSIVLLTTMVSNCWFRLLVISCSKPILEAHQRLNSTRGQTTSLSSDDSSSIAKCSLCRHCRRRHCQYVPCYSRKHWILWGVNLPPL